MEPNFHDKDYLIVNKLAYTGGNTPQKGDVITFYSTLKDDEGKKLILIKRVVGLPGDKIRIKGGKVYVNGEVQDQSFTKDGTTETEDGSEYMVGEGEYFCMGDNRNDSMDSRELGCIGGSVIIGKVVFRMFPLSNIGKIEEYL